MASPSRRPPAAPKSRPGSGLSSSRPPPPLPTQSSLRRRGLPPPALVTSDSMRRAASPARTVSFNQSVVAANFATRSSSDLAAGASHPRAAEVLPLKPGAVPMAQIPGAVRIVPKIDLGGAGVGSAAARPVIGVPARFVANAVTAGAGPPGALPPLGPPRPRPPPPPRPPRPAAAPPQSRGPPAPAASATALAQSPLAPVGTAAPTPAPSVRDVVRPVGLSHQPAAPAKNAVPAAKASSMAPAVSPQPRLLTPAAALVERKGPLPPAAEADAVGATGQPITQSTNACDDRVRGEKGADARGRPDSAAKLPGAAAHDAIMVKARGNSTDDSNSSSDAVGAGDSDGDEAMRSPAPRLRLALNVKDPSDGPLGPQGSFTEVLDPPEPLSDAARIAFTLPNQPNCAAQAAVDRDLGAEESTKEAGKRDGDGKEAEGRSDDDDPANPAWRRKEAAAKVKKSGGDAAEEKRKKSQLRRTASERLREAQARGEQLKLGESIADETITTDLTALHHDLFDISFKQWAQGGALALDNVQQQGDPSAPKRATHISWLERTVNFLCIVLYVLATLIGLNSSVASKSAHVFLERPFRSTRASSAVSGLPNTAVLDSVLRLPQIAALADAHTWLNTTLLQRPSGGFSCAATVARITFRRAKLTDEFILDGSYGPLLATNKISPGSSVSAALEDVDATFGGLKFAWEGGFNNRGGYIHWLSRCTDPVGDAEGRAAALNVTDFFDRQFGSLTTEILDLGDLDQEKIRLSIVHIIGADPARVQRKYFEFGVSEGAKIRSAVLSSLAFVCLVCAASWPLRELWRYEAGFLRKRRGRSEIYLVVYTLVVAAVSTTLVLVGSFVFTTRAETKAATIYTGALANTTSGTFDVADFNALSNILIGLYKGALAIKITNFAVIGILGIRLINMIARTHSGDPLYRCLTSWQRLWRQVLVYEAMVVLAVGTMALCWPYRHRESLGVLMNLAFNRWPRGFTASTPWQEFVFTVLLVLMKLFLRTVPVAIWLYALYDVDYAERLMPTVFDDEATVPFRFWWWKNFLLGNWGRRRQQQIRLRQQQNESSESSSSMDRIAAEEDSSSGGGETTRYSENHVLLEAEAPPPAAAESDRQWGWYDALNPPSAWRRGLSTGGPSGPALRRSRTPRGERRRSAPRIFLVANEGDVIAAGAAKFSEAAAAGRTNNTIFALRPTVDGLQNFLRISRCPFNKYVQFICASGVLSGAMLARRALAADGDCFVPGAETAVLRQLFLDAPGWPPERFSTLALDERALGAWLESSPGRLAAELTRDRASVVEFVGGRPPPAMAPLVVLPNFEGTMLATARRREGAAEALEAVGFASAGGADLRATFTATALPEVAAAWAAAELPRLVDAVTLHLPLHNIQARCTGVFSVGFKRRKDMKHIFKPVVEARAVLRGSSTKKYFIASLSVLGASLAGALLCVAAATITVRKQRRMIAADVPTGPGEDLLIALFETPWLWNLSVVLATGCIVLIVLALQAKSSGSDLPLPLAPANVWTLYERSMASLPFRSKYVLTSLWIMAGVSAFVGLEALVLRGPVTASLQSTLGRAVSASLGRAAFPLFVLPVTLAAYVLGTFFDLFKIWEVFLTLPVSLYVSSFDYFPALLRNNPGAAVTFALLMWPSVAFFGAGLFLALLIRAYPAARAEMMFAVDAYDGGCGRVYVGRSIAADAVAALHRLGQRRRALFAKHPGSGAYASGDIIAPARGAAAGAGGALAGAAQAGGSDKRPGVKQGVKPKLRKRDGAFDDDASAGAAKGGAGGTAGAGPAAVPGANKQVMNMAEYKMLADDVKDYGVSTALDIADRFRRLELGYHLFADLQERKSVAETAKWAQSYLIDLERQLYEEVTQLARTARSEESKLRHYLVLQNTSVTEANDLAGEIRALETRIVQLKAMLREAMHAAGQDEDKTPPRPRRRKKDS